MSVRQPGTREPEGGAESFPDPKRSWGRTGSLLATWGVLLLAVYFTGWVFDGIVDKSPESSEDEAPGTPSAAAWQFLDLALTDRQPDDADGLMCDGDVQLSGTQVLGELTTWEESNDVKANVTLSFDDESGVSDGEATVFPIEARVETGQSFIPWKYEVSVRENGSTYCVSKVENVTPPQD